MDACALVMRHLQSGDAYTRFWKFEYRQHLERPTTSKQTALNSETRPSDLQIRVARCAVDQTDTASTQSVIVSGTSQKLKYCGFCHQRVSESRFSKSQRNLRNGWCKLCCKLNVSLPPTSFDCDHAQVATRSENWEYSLDKQDADEVNDDADLGRFQVEEDQNYELQ